LNQLWKDGVIPKLLFSLHQFFENQEYRFFLQGKFTKIFIRRKSGRNLLTTYIIVKKYRVKIRLNGSLMLVILHLVPGMKTGIKNLNCKLVK